MYLEREYNRLLRLKIALLGRGGCAYLAIDFKLNFCIGGRTQGAMSTRTLGRILAAVMHCHNVSACNIAQRV